MTSTDALSVIAALAGMCLFSTVMGLLVGWWMYGSPKRSAETREATDRLTEAKAEMGRVLLAESEKMARCIDRLLHGGRSR